MNGYEFARAVRTGRNLAHRFLSAPSAPRAGADWERLRAAAPVWLGAPARGAGPTAQRLRALAARIGDGPPTDAELAEGLEALASAAAALGDEPGDAEARAILAAVERAVGTLPPFVLGFDCTLDTDWSGDPCAWVWVLLRDDTDPDSEEFRAFSRKLGWHLWDATRAAGSARIPYSRLHTVSDALAPGAEVA
jgi:hypothetical protein